MSHYNIDRIKNKIKHRVSPISILKDSDNKDDVSEYLINNNLISPPEYWLWVAEHGIQHSKIEHQIQTFLAPYLDRGMAESVFKSGSVFLNFVQDIKRNFLPSKKENDEHKLWYATLSACVSFNNFELFEKILKNTVINTQSNPLFMVLGEWNCKNEGIQKFIDVFEAKDFSLLDVDVVKKTTALSELNHTDLLVNFIQNIDNKYFKNSEFVHILKEQFEANYNEYSDSIDFDMSPYDEEEAAEKRKEEKTFLLALEQKILMSSVESQPNRTPKTL